MSVLSHEMEFLFVSMEQQQGPFRYFPNIEIMDFYRGSKVVASQISKNRNGSLGAWIKFSTSTVAKLPWKSPTIATRITNAPKKNRAGSSQHSSSVPPLKRWKMPLWPRIIDSGSYMWSASPIFVLRELLISWPTFSPTRVQMFSSSFIRNEVLIACPSNLPSPLTTNVPTNIPTRLIAANSTFTSYPLKS